MPVAPTLKLNDGNHIPAIGLGTAHPTSFNSDPIVIQALEIGYRHFDTAWAYGNQEELGDALRKGFQQLGLKREDVFVTSKVWNNFHKKESAMKNCQTSLDQLKFDYVDLLLMHWPIGFKEDPVQLLPVDEDGNVLFSDVDFVETWEALEECKKKGQAKSIGVSNFGVEPLKRLMENCSIKPTVNQVECHPYNNQKELLEFCKKHDIILTTYAPLAVPSNQPNQIGKNLHVLEDPVVLDIAKKHNKSPAQVTLRWAVQRGTIPLPRSNKKHRLQENFDVFDFQLTSEEVEKIDGLNKSTRAYPFDRFKGHFLYSSLQ